MRKRRIALVFWVLVLIFAVAAEAMYIKRISANWYQKAKIDEYGVQISYPRTYRPIEKEETNVEKISSSITTVITEIDKADAVSVDLVKELIHTKSDQSQITLLVEGIKTEKTNKSIEEICKDYITMFRVYNERYTLFSSDYNEVEINGVKGGRVELYIYGKSKILYPGIIAYLFPLEDREITITFTGTDEIFQNGKEEIEKIINSVKFYEISENSSNSN